MQGDNRGKNFQDVGGLVEDRLCVAGHSQFGDLFGELDLECRAELYVGELSDDRAPARRPDDRGDVVPHEFGHDVRPPRHNALVTVYRRVPTLSVRRD
ncbi:hypothetical protein [[Mycobacterium] burgundiense]|uniref:hypothetical protein n=1 Tax=[Mycobacterium] burgundiense TaxID=3064286 RepID=UPI0028056B16|nr:hypothetical protein [Mycolicibacterium sp. MU0053]